jgi:TetR/AcrR family fatty acid metabolism transcriptional regulator
LIYSYFGNKDDILFSLFHERWQMLIDYIERVRKEGISADAKLQKIGNFIIRSYEREPDLIKVLILHIVPHSPFFEKNREAVMLTFRLLQCIIEEGQEKNVFNRSLNPQIAAHGFYGAIIQILVGWIKGLFPDFRPNVVEACQFIQNLVESWSVKPLNPKSPMPTEILSH